MNQKGFAPILIVVVILAIFLGGYFLGQQKIKPTPSQLTTQPSPSPATSPVQIGTEETANWKTYTNTKYGFSFKYPGDYFKFQGDSRLGFFVATSAPQGGNGPKFLGIDDIWLSAGSLSGVNTASLDQYLESIPFYVSAQKIPITMGGVSGYKAIYTSMVGPAEPLKPQYTYEGLALKDSKLYSISVTSWSKNTLDRNQNTFDQILSTFKFTR